MPLGHPMLPYVTNEGVGVPSALFDALGLTVIDHNLDDGGMVFLGRCTIPGPAASEDLPPLS
jgi:hypothetical protein